MSTLRSDLIHLAAASTPEVKAVLLPLLTKKTATPDELKGKKFKNPETGRMVLFNSLPKKEQAKILKGLEKKKKDAPGKEQSTDFSPETKAWMEQRQKQKQDEADAEFKKDEEKNRRLREQREKEDAASKKKKDEEDAKLSPEDREKKKKQDAEKDWQNNYDREKWKKENDPRYKKAGSALRTAAIRLAASNPGPVRDALLPVLKKTALRDAPQLLLEMVVTGEPLKTERNRNPRPGSLYISRFFVDENGMFGPCWDWMNDFRRLWERSLRGDDFSVPRPKKEEYRRVYDPSINASEYQSVVVEFFETKKGKATPRPFLSYTWDRDSGRGWVEKK